MDQPASEPTLQQAENEIGRIVSSGWQNFGQAQGLNPNSEEINQISQATQGRIIRYALLGQEINPKNVSAATERFFNDRGITYNQEKLATFTQDLVEKTKEQNRRITQLSPYSLSDQVRRKLPVYPQLTVVSFRNSIAAQFRQSVRTPAKQILDAVGKEKNLIPEWQKAMPLLEQGITREVLDYSLEEYRRAGLEENHPTIKAIEEAKQIFTPEIENTPAYRTVRDYYQTRYPDEQPYLPETYVPLFTPPEQVIIAPRRPILPAPIRRLYHQGLNRVFSPKVKQWLTNRMGVKIATKKVISKAIAKAIPRATTKIGSAITKGVASFGKKIGSLGSLAVKGLSTAATSAGTALSAITSASVPAILPLLVPIVIIVLFFFVIFVTKAQTARFHEEGLGEYVNYPGDVVAARSDPNAPLAERVIFVLNSCGLTHVNQEKNNWGKTVACLNSSDLPNANLIIGGFRYSVWEVEGSCLQCVGFVRGVKAAEGNDPGDDGISRHARDYLSKPPADYELFTNLSQIAVGDIVVSHGVTYGHIGIVIEVTTDSVSVAQAWGSEKGRLEIRKTALIYFKNTWDGFLRVK